VTIQNSAFGRADELQERRVVGRDRQADLAPVRLHPRGAQFLEGERLGRDLAVRRLLRAVEGTRQPPARELPHQLEAQVRHAPLAALDAEGAAAGAAALRKEDIGRLQALGDQDKVRGRRRRRQVLAERSLDQAQVRDLAAQPLVVVAERRHGIRAGNAPVRPQVTAVAAGSSSAIAELFWSSVEFAHVSAWHCPSLNDTDSLFQRQ
jgi:hypothetical protein